MTRNVRRVTAGVARSGVESAHKKALSLGRTAWLAGLGLAASAGEIGTAAFAALVEKGRRRRRTPVEKAQEAIVETGRGAVKLVEETGRAAVRRAAALLDQIGVPSRVEIRAIKARVEALRSRLS